MVDQPRRHPLYGPNKLKLGVFGMNGHGTVLTRHPSSHTPTWEGTLRVTQAIDRAGFEAVVPYSRWKAFGDARHVSAQILDPFVWAGGLAARTDDISVFSTIQSWSTHPILAAKQGATVDLISNGRFVLNLVCGWFEPEIEMFGQVLMPHDRRYDHAEEWITVVRRLWREPDQFDFEGEFFQLRDAMLAPKPVRPEGPPVMNAGSSPRGRHFAAKYADVAFIIIPDDTPSVVRDQVASYKKFALEEYGREIQVWAHSLVVQRENMVAGHAAFEEFIGPWLDTEAVDQFVKYQVKNHEKTAPEVLREVRRTAAGGGGVHLFGSAEDIARKMKSLSDAGLDGILLCFVDYENGTRDFIRDVLPQLEQEGLRRPVSVAVEAA